MAVPPHDAAPLDSLEAVASFLADVFDSGDPDRVAGALGAVARCARLDELAAAVGMPRDQLREALNSGALSLDERLALMKVIDLHLPPRQVQGAPVS
jgi:probable addiction module antidote protein